MARTARDRAPRAVNAATTVFHRAGWNQCIVGLVGCGDADRCKEISCESLFCLRLSTDVCYACKTA